MALTTSLFNGLMLLRFDTTVWKLLDCAVSSEGFPSGQREQTVNLPALPSKVRILPPPPLGNQGSGIENERFRSAGDGHFTIHERGKLAEKQSSKAMRVRVTRV